MCSVATVCAGSLFLFSLMLSHFPAAHYQTQQQPWVTEKGSTVHSTEQKTWPLSQMPEAAGGCRVKGQYKAATISCSVNPLDSEMDSSIKSSRRSIYEYSLLETVHFKSN